MSACDQNSRRVVWPLSFVVPGVPVAQPRQRQRIVTDSRGRSFASNYTPAKHPVNAFKASVRMALREQYDGPPLNVPLGMLLGFVMPRPSNRVWKTKPMPREWYVAKKNDWDNLGKAASDALNELLYTDDGMLSVVMTLRMIASGDEQSHTQIVVAPLGDVQPWLTAIEQISQGVPATAVWSSAVTGSDGG